MAPFRVQLLINFTNEQLHQHFAIALFKTEQEIYASEGIVWPGIEWEDNTGCLEMISGKGPSVFNQLTEYSRLPKAVDEDMTERLLSDHRKNKYARNYIYVCLCVCVYIYIYIYI